MYVWTEYYKNELIVNSLPLVQDGLFEIVERLLSDYNIIINDEHNSDNESLSEIKQFCNDFMADYKGYTQKLFNDVKLHPTIIDLNYVSPLSDTRNFITGMNIEIVKNSNNRLEITASSNVNEPWQVRITYLNG